MVTSTNSDSLGGTPQASEFGASLRDMRVAHDGDLSAVAAALRIRQPYLKAIEEGRFDDLPGPTYAAEYLACRERVEDRTLPPHFALPG